MRDHHTGDVMIALGIGILLGAAGALLLAPASGRETRKRLGRMGTDAIDKAREGLDTAKEFASHQARGVEHALREGKEAYLREAGR